MTPVMTRVTITTYLNASSSQSPDNNHIIPQCFIQSPDNNHIIPQCFIQSPDNNHIIPQCFIQSPDNNHIIPQCFIQSPDNNNIFNASFSLQTITIYLNGDNALSRWSPHTSVLHPDSLHSSCVHTQSPQDCASRLCRCCTGTAPLGPIQSHCCSLAFWSELGSCVKVEVDVLSSRP